MPTMLSSRIGAGAHGNARRVFSISTRGGNHVRHFRIGLWSSYLDPVFEKEMQRRHRVLKYKYAAAINRKLTWDRYVPRQKSGWKSFMCGSWHWKDSRPGGRWISLNELRNAFEDYTAAPEPARNARNSSTLTTAPSSELEYHIDAISGRKVFKADLKDSSKPVQASQTKPISASKGYKLQFSDLHPPPVINLDGPPIRQEELNAYNNPYNNEPSVAPAVKQDPMAPTEAELNTYRNKKTTARYDPDSPPITSEELGEYREPYKFNEPDGQLPTQPQYPQMPSEAELDLYRKQKSKATFDTESPPLTAEELKLYREPYKYNEPDGQGPVVVDYMAPTKEELDLYRKTDPAIYDHDSPELTPKELKAYSKPYMYNEPDGQPEVAKDSLAPSQEELDHYRGGHSVFAAEKGTSRLARSLKVPSKPRQAVSIIKPSLPKISNNRLVAFRTAETDTREDLDLLRPSDVRARSGIIKASKHETEAQKLAKRRELEDDFEKVQKENNTDGSKTLAEAQGLKAKMEILRYQMDVVEANRANKDAFKTKDSKSAGKKMTGSFTRDFPEEFSTTWVTQKDTLVPKAGEDPWGFSKEPSGLELSYQQEKENAIQAEENEYAAGTAKRELFSRSPTTTRLQTSLDRRENGGRAAANCDASGYSKAPCGLETSYKEECVANGDPNPSIFHSSYGTPKVAASKTEQEIANEKRKQHKDLVREVRAIYESEYGVIDSKHRQTAALAEAATTRLNEMSRKTNELNRRLSSVSADVKKQAHEAETRQLEAESARLSSSSPPTLYKILAYDPTMQEVNIAETTSIVTDTSGVLTPAEVLLRLSNPTKFFPHFAPLRNEGFEIVSGSGDVLVFRKVRGGAVNQAGTIKVTTTIPRTNPVDGTSSAKDEAVEKFKSNIDVRREERVFSGGKASWEDEKKSRRSSGKGKRLLIGAGWVAACSYAVGVVSEFFTTGGSDGAGSIGL